MTPPPYAVYVAGGSSERLTVVRPYVDRLLAAGVVITYDWTRDPGWEGSPTIVDLMRAADRDMRAIRSADVVWYLAPEKMSEGSAAELGAALALGKRVIVSGPHASAHGRIFPLLAIERYETHESVAGFLEKAFGAHAP